MSKLETRTPPHETRLTEVASSDQTGIETVFRSFGKRQQMVYPWTPTRSVNEDVERLHPRSHFGLVWVSELLPVALLLGRDHSHHVVWDVEVGIAVLDVVVILEQVHQLQHRAGGIRVQIDRVRGNTAQLR